MIVRLRMLPRLTMICPVAINFGPSILIVPTFVLHTIVKYMNSIIKWSGVKGEGIWIITVWINITNRIIHTILKQIMTQQRAALTQQHIRVNEPTPLGIIVPALQIIQSGVEVEYISAVPERVVYAQRACHAADLRQRRAPCIVLVFYYDIACAVKNRNDVPLQVVQIAVALPQ